MTIHTPPYACDDKLTEGEVQLIVKRIRHMLFVAYACRNEAGSISLGTDLDDVANLKMSPAGQHFLTSPQHNCQLAIDLIIT